MTARLLDGRAVASRRWRELSDRVAALVAMGVSAPRLAVLRFDDAGPSLVYTSSLLRAARSVGIEPVEIAPARGISSVDLAARIGALNRDTTISGIVLAQPLPDHLDLPAVVALIDPDKDVDGTTPTNGGRLARGERAYVPATALAVMAILDAYEIPVAGRRAVVIGRSPVVGRPVAELLLRADASVTVCHRRTRNLARETRRAEILVAAAGSPGLVRPEMVNRSAVVIDAGINTTPEGVVGDVLFDAVRPVVTAITPVPGGVGPVTTMMVLEQTVDASERAARARDAGEEIARFAGPPRPRQAGPAR